MAELYSIIFLEKKLLMDREGFEPSISPMPRAYPTSLDDRPTKEQMKNLVVKVFLYSYLRLAVFRDFRIEN